MPPCTATSTAQRLWREAPKAPFCLGQVWLPVDYLQVCGRRQCRDPAVDFCFFSGRIGHTPAAFEGAAASGLSSLPLRRALRWRPAPAVVEVPRPLPRRSAWPRFPRRTRPMCYEGRVDRGKPLVRWHQPAPVARSCDPKSCCRRSNQFFVCDSDSGDYLSRTRRAARKDGNQSRIQSMRARILEEDVVWEPSILE